MNPEGFPRLPASDFMTVQNPRTLKTAASADALLVKFATMRQPPLLQTMRSRRGWLLFQRGKGKLLHHADTADFSETPCILLPGPNASVAAVAEYSGGLFLPAGFAARLSAAALSVTMIVAYAISESEALRSILSGPEKFTSAAPCHFLLLALLALAFGPGAFAVERRLSQLPVNTTG
jgi:putative oxidoreductase